MHLRHNDDVALFHYNDLLVDLRGQLRHLADVLEISVNEARLEEFTATASFDRMRQRLADLVPTDLAAWAHRGWTPTTPSPPPALPTTTGI